MGLLLTLVCGLGIWGGSAVMGAGQSKQQLSEEIIKPVDIDYLFYPPKGYHETEQET